MKSAGSLAMLWRRCVQETFVLIEFVIILLVITFLLATAVPGLLRVRKRSQASKIATLT